jgi:hypothetical protein
LEQSELETLIGELETRVERLRSLYEQYFVGIERIEPSVPRKDVERRLYVLRRTQIRNTGLRFRFQNALLRYNTYQTYWIRICRQIEEGTYKRDLRRANARFAVPARPKRQSELNLEKVKEEARDSALPEALSLELDEDESVNVDLDFDANDEGAAEKLTKSGPSAQPQILAEKPSSAKPPRPGPAPRPPPPPARAVRAPADRDPSGEPRRAPSDLPTQGGASAKRVPPPLPHRASGTDGGHLPTEGPPRKSPSPPAGSVADPKPVAVKVKTVQAIEVAKTTKKGENLSEERVRQIYNQYVDTKRSQQESTASFTYENLAKSLRDSSEKLRQKHGGKSVDFEVAVKDGKTILRPIVK